MITSYFISYKYTKKKKITHAVILVREHEFGQSSQNFKFPQWVFFIFTLYIKAPTAHGSHFVQRLLNVH
jgi:hypothetical protein